MSKHVHSNALQSTQNQCCYCYMYCIHIKLSILSKIINATLLFLTPFIMSWTQRSKTFSKYTKAYFSQILFTNLSKYVLVNEIIHPPHRCGISRCWLDSVIFAQVCLRLATIKDHSNMCSFITQHNATDVTSFEGAWNCHADCRNVHQSCYLWIECSFFYHKPPPKAFQRIWQYIQPQTTCNHTSPGPPHPASSPPRSSETSHPGQLLKQSVWITKEFLHKLSETVSGKLICMLVILIEVSTWLQFIVVIDLSGQMLTFDGVWYFGKVFSSRMNPSFHCTGQMTDSVYGVVWVSGLLMSMLWIEWPMVAVGLWYGQTCVMKKTITGAF